MRLACAVLVVILSIGSAEFAVYGSFSRPASAAMSRLFIQPRPAPLHSSVTDAVWALALRLVWEDGLVPPAGPDDLGRSAEDAIAQALALEDGRDRPAAFAAWIAGAAAWDDAVRRASERAAATGERVRPELELPAATRRVLLRAWAEALTYAARLSLESPIGEPCTVTSGFGLRRHPVLGRVRAHNGIDLSVPVGTEVLATQSGRVVEAGYGRLNGWYVVVDHGEGLRTWYLHLDAVTVQEGQAVGRGQPLGRSGESGRVTGPHLHYEVELRGERIDPLALMYRSSS